MKSPSPGVQLRIYLLVFLALICASADSVAQTQAAPPIQVYGGYSWLSNSFNGVPGSQQGLNGWNAGVAFPAWHHLRFRLDYSMYRGMNLGDPQHAFAIMGGGQYEVNFHRERFYAVGLAGEGGLNGTWYKPDTGHYKNGNTGEIASFAAFLGGGVDTPIGAHTAFRIEGGVEHTSFNPIGTLPYSEPYHVNGLPNYFGRVSAGVVWMPRLGSSTPVSESHAPVESEIIFEGMNSVGHFHIFANSWWSYLSTAGVEYDRHSWGNFLGAHADYSGEILPVVILRQPHKLNEFGIPRSTNYDTVPGLAVLPIGVRLIWRDGARVKPYYVIKGGISGYTEKAFSNFASYENFALDQSIGMQFRVTERTDFRAGFGVFHQSNGFVVPSNPGLDEMNWNVGISYHLGKGQATQ
jgi:Lipid A 3-O-deacylase (PagL)